MPHIRHLYIPDMFNVSNSKARTDCTLTLSHLCVSIRSAGGIESVNSRRAPSADEPPVVVLQEEIASVSDWSGCNSLEEDLILLVLLSPKNSARQFLFNELF